MLSKRDPLQRDLQLRRRRCSSFDIRQVQRDGGGAVAGDYGAVKIFVIAIQSRSVVKAAILVFRHIRKCRLDVCHGRLTTVMVDARAPRACAAL